MQAVEAAVQAVSKLDAIDDLPEKIVGLAQKLLHYANTGELPKDSAAPPAAGSQP